MKVCTPSLGLNLYLLRREICQTTELFLTLVKNTTRSLSHLANRVWFTIFSEKNGGTNKSVHFPMHD